MPTTPGTDRASYMPFGIGPRDLHNVVRSGLERSPGRTRWSGGDAPRADYGTAQRDVCRSGGSVFIERNRQIDDVDRPVVSQHCVDRD